MKEINLEEILDKYWQGSVGKTIMMEKPQVVEAMKDLCTQLLQLASEEVKIDDLGYIDGEEWVDKYEINKESITNLINRIK